MPDFNNITITEYINNVVLGYLLDDLESMSKIMPLSGKSTGAVGFPMIMTICSGIELLGGLLSPVAFSTSAKAGRVYFDHYWNEYLSKQHKCYSGQATSVYQLMRNPIAHVFMTKPGITVIKNPDKVSKVGLVSTNYEMTIDCIKFYQDFKASILTHFISKLQSLESSMQLRLNEMLEKYGLDSSAILGMGDVGDQLFASLDGIRTSVLTSCASGVAYTLRDVSNLNTNSEIQKRKIGS